MGMAQLWMEEGRLKSDGLARLHTGWGVGVGGGFGVGVGW